MAKTENEEKTVTMTEKELKNLMTGTRSAVNSVDDVGSMPAHRERKKKVAKSQEEYLNEKVPLYLIKDNNEYADDVTVTYNGVNYRIKRGMTVMVPRFLKLVVDANNRQKMIAGDYANHLAKAFEEKTERVILGAKVESGLPTR